MSRVKLFGILILMFIILPVNVYAADNDIFLECAKSEVKIGETTECTVSAICSTECTSVEFGLGADYALAFTTSIDIASSSALQPYEGTSFSLPSSKIAVVKKGETAAPTGTKFTIGTFTVKVGDSATVGSTYNINLTNGSLRNDSPNALGTNINVNAGIKALAGSSDGSGDGGSGDGGSGNGSEVTAGGLSNLTVTSGGNLVPGFNKNQTTFGVYLDSSDTTKFKLQATAETATDTISAKNTDTGEAIDLSNEITFQPGDGGSMSIKITVGTGSSAKEYTVIVQRSKPSGVGEATLSSLMVGNTRVNLVNGKLDYVVTLDADTIKDYVIVAELTDSTNFKFDNTDILSPHDLGGEQELEIKIVPKDANSSYGSETYTLVIKAGDSGGSSSSGGTSSGGNSSGGSNVQQNPKTGGSAIVMGLLLIISFAASIYYYKRNMSQYE